MARFYDRMGQRHCLVSGNVLLDLSRNELLRPAAWGSSRADHNCILHLYGAAPRGIRRAGSDDGKKIDGGKSPSFAACAGVLDSDWAFSRSRVRRSVDPA